MKETVSPEGYSRDPSVKILNIRAGQRTWANSAGTDTGWNYDNRQVTLSLQKQSGEPELTQDHSCYSLAGAVYGVYRSREEALQDRNRAATLQTDAAGNSNQVSLDAGTYYVREVTASPGFMTCSGNCDEADGDGIHTVRATEYGGGVCLYLYRGAPFPSVCADGAEEGAGYRRRDAVRDSRLDAALDCRLL